MNTSYFLGANTAHGFYSLYHHFACAPGDTLHIIKGGPGTGKSTFMRRIGQAAEDRGYDVEYILCSGDPDSLDGVYIPALHTGWADGTAPHVLEPSPFGVTGDYVNLGQFCDIAQLPQEDITALTRSYRRCYDTAYAYLTAAGLLWRRRLLQPDAAAEEKLRSRARAKIRKELSGGTPSAPATKRFLRALSCQGDVFLADTVNALCSRLCLLESEHSLEQLFFAEITAELDARSVPYIHCPSPLCPEETEAILLPAERLCFLSSHTAPEFSGTTRTIHLDSYISARDKTEHRRRERLCHQLLTTAYTHLSQAKQLHDDLEQLYRPALDTDGLNSYTEQIIHSLFQ